MTKQVTVLTDEEAAASQLEVWLQAWSRTKDSPKDKLELLPHLFNCGTHT